MSSDGRMERFARRLWAGDLGTAGRMIDRALIPAESLYRTGIALRNRAYDRGLLKSTRADLPVISVGNIAVGGSGKTPFASWLAAKLQERGEHPVLVHGGYADDEPELHRSWLPDVPVIVDRDRVRAAGRARALGGSVLVLDDAFQHRRLRRDLDIVLISVERFGTAHRLLPRGPWREPAAALERAGVVVSVRRTADAKTTAAAVSRLERLAHRSIMRVHLRAERWQHDGGVAPPPDSAAVLVAGIAEPTLFAQNARAAGAAIATELMFPDHHVYTGEDVTLIEAAALGRAVVTTAKDWVKLRTALDPSQVWVLEQDVHIEEGESLIDDALDRVLR
jgi:tetraacyldisaccharide 4'-kinase